MQMEAVFLMNIGSTEGQQHPNYSSSINWLTDD